MKTKSTIKDIFSGKTITAWEDEGFVWVSLPWVTLCIPKDEWAEYKKELKALSR